MTSNDLPDYHGCLNLLHAIYAQWWRDAQRSPEELALLAQWIDQPIDTVRSNRPSSFRSFRKGDLYDEDDP